MSDYVFREEAADRELHRLRLVEEALDPETVPRLESTGVGPGWRCLELGAGAGSIARWLGGRVRPEGEVVLADLNTEHLRELSGPPFRTVTGDFLEAALPGGLDLAHCRYVLIHNRRRQAMLERLAALLRPGGILVAEEPDFTSARRLNPDADPARRRVNDAICALFEQMGLDPACGLRLPADAGAAGLRVLRVEGRIHLNRGGETLARMMAESTRALGDRYAATGKADAADIARYIASADDPGSWFVYYATVAVIAERPGADA